MSGSDYPEIPSRMRTTAQAERKRDVCRAVTQETGTRVVAHQLWAVQNHMLTVDILQVLIRNIAACRPQVINQRLLRAVWYPDVNVPIQLTIDEELRPKPVV